MNKIWLLPCHLTAENVFDSEMNKICLFPCHFTAENAFDHDMNGICLLPCRLLPKMYLAHSCLISLQKPYDPMVILYATGNAEKARYHLVRLTKTCNQLVRSHMKYKSDLLPSGDIYECL